VAIKALATPFHNNDARTRGRYFMVSASGAVLCSGPSLGTGDGDLIADFPVILSTFLPWIVALPPTEGYCLFRPGFVRSDLFSPEICSPGIRSAGFVRPGFCSPVFVFARGVFSRGRRFGASASFFGLPLRASPKKEAEAPNPIAAQTITKLIKELTNKNEQKLETTLKQEMTRKQTKYKN
jgi:hypothetical protein